MWEGVHIDANMCGRSAGTEYGLRQGSVPKVFPAVAYRYLVWQQNVASSPAEDPAISEQERQHILANTPAGSQGRVEAVPWGMLLSRKEVRVAVCGTWGMRGDKGPKPRMQALSVLHVGLRLTSLVSCFGAHTWPSVHAVRFYVLQVWAIILCHFCHNWGLFILLTWMPAYYSQVLGLSLMQSGGLSVLPWVAMTIMSNVAGWAADAMVARGVSVTNVRKVSTGTRQPTVQHIETKSL